MEHRILRGIFGIKEEEILEGGKHYIIEEV
jgi:hypothetical protein